MTILQTLGIMGRLDTLHSCYVLTLGFELLCEEKLNKISGNCEIERSGIAMEMVNSWYSSIFSHRPLCSHLRESLGRIRRMCAPQFDHCAPLNVNGW